MFDPEKVERWEDNQRDGTGLTVVEASEYDLLLQRYRAAMKFIMSLPAKNGWPGLEEVEKVAAD